MHFVERLFLSMQYATHDLIANLLFVFLFLATECHRITSYISLRTILKFYAFIVLSFFSDVRSKGQKLSIILLPVQYRDVHSLRCY